MKKLYAKMKGTRVVGTIQWIFYILGIIIAVVGTLTFMDEKVTGAIMWGIALLLFVSGALFAPMKAIVKAADYYVATIEDSYEVVKGSKPASSDDSQA